MKKKQTHTHTVVSSSQKKAQRGRSSQWRESMSHYIFCLKVNLRDGLISKGFEAWGREECPSKSLTAPNLTPVKVSSADGSPNHEADCCGLSDRGITGSNYQQASSLLGSNFALNLKSSSRRTFPIAISRAHKLRLTEEIIRMDTAALFSVGLQMFELRLRSLPICVSITNRRQNSNLCEWDAGGGSQKRRIVPF